MTKGSRIQELAGALEQGRKQFEEIMAGIQEASPAFAADEIYDLREDQPLEETAEEMQLSFYDVGREAADAMPDAAPMNRLAAGDNLDYMVWLLRNQNMAGKLQLIYVDPPFFTGAKYQSSVQITDADGRKSPLMKVGAYEDKWEHDLGAYLQMLAVRFYLMRELLSETGSIWVHLDWHGSHYVKMMLDEIFGHEHFINEVVWTYKSGGASKRSFARKHDTLLFYGKTKAYKFRPLQEKSYNREGKPYRFKGVEEFEDDRGWYTLVNMKDVWSIDMVGRTSAERLGYATQKPEKLLERIVEACTDPGDLCADFFAGTGTLGAVCARRGRSWILCDTGDAAIAAQILRMGKLGQRFCVERPVQGEVAVIEETASNLAEAEETAADVSPSAGVTIEKTTTTEVARPRAAVQAVIEEKEVRLVSCQPDLSQIRQQDREIVAEYMDAGGLDLVRFWSVDQKQAETHTAAEILAGEDTATLADQPLEEAESMIHIVGYDMFGGRFETELTISDEEEEKA